MRVVLDAVGVRPGSAAIVTRGLLQGWAEIAPGDEIVVATDGPPAFASPASAEVVPLVAGRAGTSRRLWAQTWGVRRLCRQRGADALLSALTAGSFLGASCPRGAIVYDLRHEVMPEQFSARRRLARRAAYGWTFSRAEALFCISERTRSDLLARRPRLAGKAHATLLGADHAAQWRPAPEAVPGVAAAKYLLAFGHFPNKNVSGVLGAWALCAARGDVTLTMCGMGESVRAAALRQARILGIADSVTFTGRLDDEAFARLFAGASAVAFPSDFEGFGLPVIEAMLLGIPVVISPDAALAEVSGGHAEVAADGRAGTLAAAIDRALERSVAQTEAAAAHARTFTWARMASQVRGVLTGFAAARAGSRRR